MLQKIILSQPIPSCDIHGLVYDNGKWMYVYAAKVPFELTNRNTEDLIVYEFISDLVVKNGEGQHPDAVNIHFKTLDQYLALLEMQRVVDLAFRKQWLDKHPDAQVPEFAKRELQHRNYEYD